jgi:hypothetical protein
MLYMSFWVRKQFILLLLRSCASFAELSARGYVKCRVYVIAKAEPEAIQESTHAIPGLLSLVPRSRNDEKLTFDTPSLCVLLFLF